MSSSQASSPSRALRVSWAAATAEGDRPRNEDRFGVVRGPSGLAMGVADGMGGHPAGDRASALVVDALLEAARSDPLDDLAALVATFNRRLLNAGRRDPSLAGSGTTLVAVLIAGGTAHWASVGDSRLYLQRGGRLGLVAEPHELGRILVREGVLREEELTHSPVKGRLTAYLGMEEPEIESGSLELAAGDRLALVTDGVLEQGEARINGILAGAAPDRIAQALVSEPPTQDNATAVVACIDPAEGPCSAN